MFFFPIPRLPVFVLFLFALSFLSFFSLLSLYTFIFLPKSFLSFLFSTYISSFLPILFSYLSFSRCRFSPILPYTLLPLPIFLASCPSCFLIYPSLAVIALPYFLFFHPSALTFIFLYNSVISLLHLFLTSCAVCRPPFSLFIFLLLISITLYFSSLLSSSLLHSRITTPPVSFFFSGPFMLSPVHLIYF